MMNWTKGPRTALGALLMLLLLTGCALPSLSLRGSTEGPFLRAGQPIGPAEGYRAPELSVDTALRSAPGIPIGFSAEEGLGRLHGAEVPGIGPVRAVVVSLALGAPEARYTEDDVRIRVFGDSPQRRNTAVQVLDEASNGLFRMSADVLPTLLDRRTFGDARNPNSEQLRRIALEALEVWGRDTTLVMYDDDGPDGVPFSHDDDRRLDLVFVAVETDSRFPSQAIPVNAWIQTTHGRVKVEKLLMVSVPRNEPLRSHEATALTLLALGLDDGEQYYPGNPDGQISPLGKARLGWLPMTALPHPEDWVLERGQPVLIPLQDLGMGAGFWLVEQQEREIIALRAARKADGHFAITEVERWEHGSAPRTLALTRQLGVYGPRVVVTWDRGSDPAVAVVHEPIIRRGGLRAVEVTPLPASAVEGEDPAGVLERAGEGVSLEPPSGWQRVAPGSIPMTPPLLDDPCPICA